MAVLYQFNTLGSLVQGVYEGKQSISNLRRHGSFGLGTFDKLDGEMIVLDNIVYQALSDNTVRIADQLQGAPYAALTQHDVTEVIEVFTPIKSEDLLHKIEDKLLNKNLFYSVKIEGQFTNLRYRMSRKTIAETDFQVARQTQSYYSASNLTATIVGFWSPELFNGITFSGFHLHFLSENKQLGGHLLDFKLTKGKVELGKITKLEQDFPVNHEKFQKSDSNLHKISEIT